MSVRDNMVQGPIRNVSIQYKNSNYLAEEIFPSILVSPKSQLTVYNRGDFFRDEAAVRGSGAEAVRGNPSISTVDINTKNWAFAGEATDEDREEAKFNNAPPLQPDIDAIEFATDKILLKKESLVFDSICSSSSTWNGESGGEDAAGLWAAGSGNTIISDIMDAMSDMAKATGFRPNRLVMDYATFKEMSAESTILDRIQYSALGVVTENLLAQLFGLEKVLVSMAIKNTADEEESDSMTGKYLMEQNTGKGSAFLYYYGPAGLKKPNAGYICTLSTAGGKRGVYKFRVDSRHTDVYEAHEEFAVCTSHAPYLGKLFADTIQS